MTDFEFALEVLNLPIVRAGTVVFAAASFGISIWLFRKTTRLFATQERHYLIDQTRFIDDMWQKSNALILSNNDHRRVVRDMFGYESDEDLLRNFMLFNTINPVYASWRSATEGVMPKAAFVAHRDNILSNYSGDREWFVATLRKRGYAPEFVRMCEDWFKANSRAV